MSTITEIRADLAALLAKVDAAIEAEAAPVAEPLPDAGAFDLSPFEWRGKLAIGIRAPGWSAKYGEGVEGGKRFCQWKGADGLIVHAVFPASATSATAKTAAWYHFTPGTGAEPDPRLAAYTWRSGNAATDKAGTWRKWTMVGKP